MMNNYPIKHIKLLFKSMITSLIILSLSIYSVTAVADVWNKWGGFKDEYKDNDNADEYVWKEETTQLPTYPKNSDLLKIMGPAAYRNYQYLIDGKTLTVGSDGVIRFSLVIRSSSGSDNVLFDGLRCHTGQAIHYAYGITNNEGQKSFNKKTKPQWKPFRSDGVMGYSTLLAMSYFCDPNSVPLTRHEIIQNIKYGKGPVDGLYN